KFEIKQGKKMIGRVYLYFIKNDLHKQPYGLVEDLFVDETMRGQGVGRILLEAAIVEAKKRKLYKLIITSRMARTEVHGFYERHGFKKYGWEFRMDFNR
ncbi:MAG: GNAT family N-acetyltransferase, partial [Patescibacteria group bacterium]